MQRLLPGLRQCVKSMRFLTVSSTASCSCAAYAAPSHKESRWFRVTSAMAAGLQIPSHSALARPCKMMRAVLIPRLRCGVLVFYGSRARELDFNNLRADDGNLNPNMQPPAQVGELLRVSTICEIVSRLLLHISVFLLLVMYQVIVINAIVVTWLTDWSLQHSGRSTMAVLDFHFRACWVS